MKALRSGYIKLTPFQIYLLQSRYAGTEYRESDLPRVKIAWPKSTWLSRRLAKIREEQENEDRVDRQELAFDYFFPTRMRVRLNPQREAAET
jgi:hypothetical protein